MRVLTATALAAACLVLAACSDGDVGVGADPELTAPQPVLITPSPDPVAPESAPAPALTDEPAAPRTPSGPVRSMPALADAVGLEISDPARSGSGAVHVQRRKWAQYQIIVSWRVSDRADDPDAAALARTDAVKILRLIQRTRLPSYGSVLLIGTAAIPKDADGGKKITRVVRAKYTAAGIRSTAFTPERVWSQTDDKPAELHPAFR